MGSLSLDETADEMRLPRCGDEGGLGEMPGVAFRGPGALGEADAGEQGD